MLRGREDVPLKIKDYWQLHKTKQQKRLSRLLLLFCNQNKGSQKYLEPVGNELVNYDQADGRLIEMMIEMTSSITFSNSNVFK